MSSERLAAVDRAMEALASGAFCKVIFGIGSRKARRLRNLACIYGAAGVHAIDMAPHIDVLEAVQAGLRWAREYHRVCGDESRYQRPALVVSLGIDDDPHVGIPLLDRSVCATCEHCYCNLDRLCAKRPLELRHGECVDCMACVRACPFDAISVVASGIGNRALLVELFKRGADAIELHVSGATLQGARRLWESVSDVVRPETLVSFSLGSSVSTPELVREKVRWVESLHHPRVVFQAEGEPMSGTPNGMAHAGASLRLVAQIATERTNGSFVQASGGCNDDTGRDARARGLALDGIGFGSFARHLVTQVLERDVLDPTDPDIQAAVGRARDLVASVAPTSSPGRVTSRS